MNRRLASVLVAGSSMAVLTGAAVALGNSVSTEPAPAFVRSFEPGAAGDNGGTDDPATHDLGDDHGDDGARTSTTGTAVATTATTGTARATTVTSLRGRDDDPTHDVGDDHGSGGHGADDPATHDLVDDHGGSAGLTTSSSTPSTTVTTAADGDDDGDDDGGHRRRGRD